MSLSAGQEWRHNGRPPGGGHGSPLRYSCWENPMDRRAWLSTVHKITKSWTCLKQLSTTHVTIYKIDNQQGPTVQHRELYQYLVLTQNGNDSEKEYIYICVYIAESLSCMLKLTQYCKSTTFQLKSKDPKIIFKRQKWCTKYRHKRKELLTFS